MDEAGQLPVNGREIKGYMRQNEVCQGVPQDNYSVNRPRIKGSNKD